MMSQVACPYCQTLNDAQVSYCQNCGSLLITASGRLRAGQVMHNRYTILRPLSKGGMGALHLASETIASQERLVVIKEMLDYYDTKDPEGETKALKRFEAEAATLARLNIPGIPQIFDFFRDSGRNFIVMQYIQGRNLESGLTHTDDDGSKVSGQPYPADQVRLWGIELCRVLDSLAGQNIVHMDIKPANLIVDDVGEVWLVDFGTAKAQQTLQPAGKVGLEKSSVYGTVGYAPPEQALGTPETRSDVYALAATMYHLLTDEDPRNQPYAFPHLDRLPQEISAALKPALAQDVKNRITARQLSRLLSNSSAPQRAFRWQDGTQAQEPKELVAIANQNWEEAIGYYTGDAWEKWLKEVHRNDLHAQLLRIKSLHHTPDQGLDAFLRVLDPGLDLPSLSLPQPELDAGIVPWQKQVELTLDVVNLGGGCLQGRVISNTPALHVDPVEIVTHGFQKIKLVLDAGQLSPGGKVQVLSLVIDAGVGGKQPVDVKVVVPEPRLKIRPTQIDFGLTSRGEAMVGSVKVSNQGGSAFVAEVTSTAAWSSVEPARFLCTPGKSYQLKLRADTRFLGIGRNQAELVVRARCGSWEQTSRVKVNVSLSAFHTFWKVWAFPLAWLAGWTFFGSLLGSFMGTWMQTAGGQISSPVDGMLLGALFGAFLCVLPGTLIGALGRVDGKRGKLGARGGFWLGLSVGFLVGGVAGYLVTRLLEWLSYSLSTGEASGLFGGLVGGVTGLIFGAILLRMVRR
jgi:serine/threonine protein kinase